jgi:transposase
MKKTSTVRVNGNMIFKGHKLTIGVDLGDHWSCYCVLDEAGKIILEQKVATTPEAMKQTFSKIPQGLIALETGTHSPWVSRLLTELGHKVIVAHAQKVQLITKSNRKDDRHDARTLARLARIDAELLGPVRHRSAQAQIHLTVIRARAELVRARTALVNAARGLVKSYGQRLPKCGTRQVSRELGAGLHAELREVLENQRIPGIRGARGENRQGELPASRTAQTGEGGRNADRSDLCSDPGRSASVPEESRGRRFSRVVPWAQGLR